MLEQYSLRPRKEDKKKEEIYSEKTFLAIKPVEKIPAKTKDLEFGGRIGMYAKFLNS